MANATRTDAAFPGFVGRHIGPGQSELGAMLAELGLESLDQLCEQVVPSDILLSPTQALEGLPAPCDEREALDELAVIATGNQVVRSLIGQGYYDTATPAVLQRHVFENPAWYTAYTPYQAEIAQGRLEALLNFQTLISELTGLPIANASLLDEATAAAEAMTMALAVSQRSGCLGFLVDQQVFPQTLAVLQTRAEPLGIALELVDAQALAAQSAPSLPDGAFGLLLQLPGQRGQLWDPAPLLAAAAAGGVVSAVAIDPLAQVLLAPVGELGADIAVGSAQRFGVPMGFGGPHAAFFATRDAYKRQIPGRLAGRSRDAEGQPALRLALQTREQHIRRDKATSNICTAQVLLAVMAGFYAVHHGPVGLQAIAARIARMRHALAAALAQIGLDVEAGVGFGTLVIPSSAPDTLMAAALKAGFNLRRLPDAVGLSLDECSTAEELQRLLAALAPEASAVETAGQILASGLERGDGPWSQTWQAAGLPRRLDPWLAQEVFHRYHSETELLRYIQRLAGRDLSLVHGMIPLGSCTMKLNAAAELQPVSWPAFAKLHPFAPVEQTAGYRHLTAELEQWLAAITGFAGASLQPNAGSQGEYAGLLAIRAWHQSRGETHRDVCLIPASAHGTNPASAVMVGLQVVAVACDSQGNVDLADLEAKADTHADRLAALMVTYPSTHGVFEPAIRRLCDLVHARGGQVYLDGANLNAQVGLARPGDYGADVCHLNLHKTFCIPHGGGGPGVGPIAVAAHLLPFLPGAGGRDGVSVGPVAAAPLGSASILPISWMYIRMMGGSGLRLASQVALLSANLIAKRLGHHFPVLYRGQAGWVAHECILDLRPLKRSCGLEVDDLAKRLMDYGFHAPTVSWPVPGTVMVEPTESESLAELDRFCQAMVAIRAEAAALERGEAHPQDNPLKRAPHTLAAVTADQWERPYSRQQAAFPAGEAQKHDKVWPAVARIDNAFGDRNLVCTCPSVEDLETPMPAVSRA